MVDDTLEIAFYGRVGSDTAGEVLVKELQRANVDISGVRRVAGGSGQGFVVVEEGGAVLSVVAPGANFRGWAAAKCDEAWADGVVAGARACSMGNGRRCQRCHLMREQKE